jgi:hypothetical protein
VYVASNSKTKIIVGNRLIPKNLPRHFNSSDEVSVLIREPAKLIMNNILEEKNASKKYLLHGKRGVGKSAILFHLANAFTDQFLVIYIPSCLFLTLKEKTVTLTPSTWMTGRFDQNINACELLTFIHAMNYEKIKDIKIIDSYKVREDTYPSGTPLLELIEKACFPIHFNNLEQEILSSDIFGIFLKEIHLQEEKKVIFLVDEFNALYNMTTLKDFFSNPIHARQLSLVHNIRKMWHSTNQKIYKVAATSASGHTTNFPVGLVVADYIDKFGIEVKNYTKEELLLLLNYYHHRRAITFPPEFIYRQLSLLSGMNPLEVVKVLFG